jgi:uncharacterized membrane protein YhaH (DUF805 family)
MKMSWLDLFTSVDGRISRQPFWIALVCLMAVELAAYLAAGNRWSAIASLIMAYPELAVFAKRAHDRNVPTWVVGLFVAGGVVLNFLVLFDLTGPPEKPTTLFYVLVIPIGVVALILLTDFGFRRGTAGPNQYGPDPLQTNNS